MVFNSLHYLIFFPLVLIGTGLTPIRYRWVLLLTASLYFYMSWKAVYGILLIATILVDYAAARCIAGTESRALKRAAILCSLLSNLGMLGLFKYADFLGQALNGMFQIFPIPVRVPHLDLILPVGISFYVFQSLSYTIDVYRGHIKPETHLGYFALYVTFFPQLVAGPIERPTNLLPQLRSEHVPRFGEVAAGLKMMAWGLFKKIVIADRVSVYVNEVYGRPGDYPGQVVLLATVFFAFQIYCDFSGYTDIAIGSARVMGIRLMQNFRQPYFATSIGDFWHRWHISLSSWFRDYVYIPLGGKRVSNGRRLWNLWVTFLISGIWHGANWTFIAWGALHGTYMVVGRLTESARATVKRVIGLPRYPTLHHLWCISVTFGLVCVGWVLFRAASLSDAFLLYRRMAHIDWTKPALAIATFPRAELVLAFAAIAVMEVVHYFQRHEDSYARFMRQPVVLRWAAYQGLVLSILLFGVFESKPFIYFQF